MINNIEKKKDYDAQTMNELQFITRVIDDDCYQYIELNNITQDYFISSEKLIKECGTYTTKDIFNFINNHYNEYGSLPDRLTLIGKFNDIANELYSTTESVEYLVSELKKAKFDQDFANAFNVASDLYKNEKREQAQAYMIEAMKNLYDPSMALLGTNLFDEGLDSVVANYLDGVNNHNKYIMPLGFKEIDDEIGGIRKDGELALIQGKLGIGKTACLIKIIGEALKRNENVCFYSPELTKDEVCKRIMSYMFGLSSYKLTHYLPIDENLLKIKFDNKGKYNLWCLDSTDFGTKKPTPMWFRNYCKYHNATLLIIDGLDNKYLNDQRTIGNKNATSYEKLGNIADDLFTISKELKMPIIATVQAQRLKKDEELSNDTVSGSIDIPRVATKDIIVTRKDKGDDPVKQFDLFIEKNRHGKDKFSKLYMVDLDKNKWTYANDYNNTTIDTDDIQTTTNDTMRRPQ